MSQKQSSTLLVAALLVPALLFGIVFGLVLYAAVEDDTPPAASCGGLGVPITLPDGDALPDIAGYSEIQVGNALVILTVARDRDLDARAAQVAIATALTESKLQNLANAGEYVPDPGSQWIAQWPAWREVAMLSMNYPNDAVAPGDWDSVGLFQGRASQGWGGDGPPQEQVQNLLNPAYTAGTFYDGLVAVPGWENLPIDQAAQAVQRSAFPTAYRAYALPAAGLVEALQGVELDLAGAGPASTACGGGGTVSADGWIMPVSELSRLTGRFGDISPIRGGVRHMGLDFAAPMGSPIVAAADGQVVQVLCTAWSGRSPCNIRIDHGVNPNGQRVTSLYVHMYPDGVYATPGQQVAAGDVIAAVGSNGNSTGPHLHFEVWLDDTPVNPYDYLTAAGVDLP